MEGDQKENKAFTNWYQKIKGKQTNVPFTEMLTLFYCTKYINVYINFSVVDEIKVKEMYQR